MDRLDLTELERCRDRLREAVVSQTNDPENAALQAMPQDAGIPVHITPKEWAILRDLLRKYAPGRKVWAYGSRATGRRLKRYSDLDLALSAAPDAADDDTTLEEAFDWSHIPYRVEYVVLPEISETFRKRIEPDFVELPFE